MPTQGDADDERRILEQLAQRDSGVLDDLAQDVATKKKQLRLSANRKLFERLRISFTFTGLRSSFGLRNSFRGQSTAV